MTTLTSVFFFAASTAFVSSLFTAYIGPGTGLSAIGAILALGISLIVAFFAFVWYPIRRMRRRWRIRAETSAVPTPGRTIKP